jgi:hypothetical protein
VYNHEIILALPWDVKRGISLRERNVIYNCLKVKFSGKYVLRWARHVARMGAIKNECRI